MEQSFTYILVTNSNYDVTNIIREVFNGPCSAVHLCEMVYECMDGPNLSWVVILFDRKVSIVITLYIKKKLPKSIYNRLRCCVTYIYF